MSHEFSSNRNSRFDSGARFRDCHSCRQSSRTRGLRPVLVFVCEVRDKVWCVQNVGTGPALDVVVAEKDRNEQLWARFKRLPPLPKGGKIQLRSAPSFFAVTYHDAENHAYSTICSGYRNRLQKAMFLINLMRTRLSRLRPKQYAESCARSTAARFADRSAFAWMAHVV